MSKYLHQVITHNLLRASFPMFYNVILTGRIMNRLSKDIYNVDKELPDLVMTTNDQIIILASGMIQFIIAGAFNYLPALGGFVLVAFVMNYVYLKSMRELTRFEAMSKSPILSFFTQILRGALYSRSCISHNYIIDVIFL